VTATLRPPAAYALGTRAVWTYNSTAPAAAPVTCRAVAHAGVSTAACTGLGLRNPHAARTANRSPTRVIMTAPQATQPSTSSSAHRPNGPTATETNSRRPITGGVAAIARHSPNRAV
jgi:hypothetical protein